MEGKICRLKRPQQNGVAAGQTPGLLKYVRAARYHAEDSTAIY
jgi:hypothetical protein